MHIRRYAKKSIVALLLGVVLVVPLIAAPNVAHAIPTESPDVIASDKAQVAVEGAKTAASSSLLTVVFTGIVNLLTFAANRLAYDAAVMLASGGPDDSSLIEYRSADAYFADYASAVAGEAVGLISENLESAGGVLSNFNLCAPSNPDILLALKLGVRSAFRRPEPLCDFKDVKDNWSGYIAKVASDSQDGVFKNEMILTQLKDAFDPQVQEFSVGVQLYTDILGKSLQESDIAKNKLLIQGPTKDVVDVITGNVQTPASYIDKDVTDKISGIKNVPTQILYATLANKDALLQVGLSAVSVFTNTLLSQLTNKLYSGLFDFDAATTDPFDVGFSSGSTREDAQARFASILAVAPLEVTDYDILSVFGTCPRDNRGLYNCVADTTFISAVARAATGTAETLQEAIDDGLVDSSWPLIPSADAARDQDPYCYTYGFCHSNLVKLRKARIISTGWELAAEDSEHNSVDDPVTLQEVIDGYDTCNTSGQRDENHPWCHLIDPQWVLKYPETQCKSLVYGQLLETSAAATRQEECVDMPSCIDEDENGTCTGGYGYCVREKNTWNFRGESCPDYAASCLSFSDMQGESKSYLLHTVDYGSCTEDNAGCLWYGTEKTDAEGDGTFDWPTVSDVATADSASDTYKSRIYFNAAAEDCDAENGGCTELYARDTNLRLNVLSNPSFEDDTDSDNTPDAWLPWDATKVTYDISGSYARSGDAALNPGKSFALQEGLTLTQGATYTMSYYARQSVSGGGDEAQTLVAFANDNDTTESIDLTGLAYSSGCSIYTTVKGVFEVSGVPAGETYERFTCTFTSPILSDPSDQLIAYIYAGHKFTLSMFTSGGVWVDDLQLEQGADVSEYHEGYSSSATTLVAKVPPAYLGCTGSVTDPADCANYATVCTESEVGCTQYSPSNGDPDVYGVTDDTDSCPSTCVGYDTYKQEPTRYEPDGDFPVYFIPDSGDTCDESEVGCDEFTRLDDESLAYFTSVRACVTTAQAAANTNDDNQATFYTWEGSDVDGYQIKTWNLLESDMDSSASITYANSGVAETNPGLAPCTSTSTTENSITCNDDVESPIGHFDTDTASCDEHDDIFSNPDCREFYDANGDIHYRAWSETVTVNDECASYRKTDLAGYNVDSNNDGIADNLLALSNCTDSGGWFDAGTATCRYYGYEAESTTCTARAAGCREYTGGRSRNSRLVLEEQFEDGGISAWEAASASGVTYSNESVATDGHSLASNGEAVWSYLYDNGSACAETTDGAGCAATTGVLGGTCTVSDGSQYCGTLAGELYAGKTYTVSFWAKGTGSVTVGFDIDAVPSAATLGSSDASFGAVTLSASSWQQYQLGPLNIDPATYATFGDNTVLAFIPGSGVSFYIDNIVLREGEDNITVIKNSWVTPAECDEGPDGTASPQYYLGCQDYTTQDSETAYLKSFSSLCSEDVVGCSAYFATHESDSAYAQVYGATCSTLDGAVVTTPTSCYKMSDGGTNYDTSSPYLCTIGVGTSSCTFDIDGYIPASALATPTYKMTHLSYGSSTHVVPADTAQFLIVGSDDECDASAAGCTELGLPTFSADRQSIAASTSAYVVNDPDTYGETLCGAADLFCAAWDAGEKGTYYFKDPQSQTCEYRTDVTIGGTSYDGWFRADTDDFCYGTCTASGDACSSDADCGAGDRCDPTVGSYIIGGDQSGIWKNGDDAYAGWVGSCSEQYSTCSEFNDVLDIPEGSLYGAVDGTGYFYLDNSELEENTLPSSQKCDGQVSQKLGCALFLDTTTSTREENASASYVASAHADALFGDSPFALVDPIDCDSGNSSITAQDGTKVDLCAQRCAYTNADIYDLGTLYTDRYSYGGSCYATSDCAPVFAESGAEVAGTCATSSVPRLESIPRLENDTNRVLKVDRDRQCSEWLSCADTQTVWDDASASYKTVCGDVALCNAYSSDGNSSFCSSWADDSTAATLDVERYAARDVSWYGDDYSGYSIANTFPVELLSQVNVAPPPGYCDLSQAYSTVGGALDFTTNVVQGTACTTDTDCDAGIFTEGERCVTDDEQIYDLVYNAGSCSDGYGVACTVGYCQETGEACSSTADCGSGEGSCVIGSCYDVDSATTCFTDSECRSGFSCDNGQCIEELGDLDVAYTSCSQATDAEHPLGGYSATVGSLSLYQSVLTKAGSCVRDLCLLSPDGSQYNVQDVRGKECRGYPEQESPFANEVVTDWKNPDPGSDPEDLGLVTTSDVSTDSDRDGTPDNVAIAPDLEPYSYVSGFEQAKTCQAGEDCTCSYNKVTYGDSSVQYYADNSAFPDVNGDAIGVCVGGTYDGVYCDQDGNDGTDGELDTISEATCEDTTDGGGTCNYATRKDNVVGLEGYCLERDTGINVNGNRDNDHRACLTWLPVDQLVGSTDIYAKYLSAGFFDDAYVCTDMRPFVDVYPTGEIVNAGYKVEDSTEEGDIACAETAGDFDSIEGDGVADGDDELGVNENNSHSSYVYHSTSDNLGCADHAACPDGFWAAMGQPSADVGANTLAEACDGDGAPEVEDCPYTCIPFGAYVNDDGTERSCDPTADGEDDLDGKNYVDWALDQAFAYGGSTGGSGWDHTYYETGRNNTTVYVVGHSITTDDDTDDTGEHEFDKMVELLQNCRAVGVPYDDTFASDDEYNFPASSTIADGSGGSYCLYSAGDACTTDADCGSAGSCGSEGVCVSSGTCVSEDDCSGSSTVTGICLEVGAGDSGTSEDTHGWRYLFLNKVDKYPACKETTQVAGDDNGTFKSYAWTDRVKYAASTFAITPTTDTTFSYMNDVLPAPFGVTAGVPNSRDAVDPPFLPASCVGVSPDYDIVPAEASMTEVCPAGYADTSIRIGDDATYAATAEARSYVDFSFVSPPSYSSTDNGGRSPDALWSVSEPKATVFGRITQVFSFLGFGHKYSWSGSLADASDRLGYGEDSGGASTYYGTSPAIDSIYDARTKGNPPTVWALDLANCEGDACEEGDENALTLNAANSGDQTSDDFFRAYLKFYAAADKNQLPIRRVIVDWQDGGIVSGSDSPDNFYKNHRGLQDGNETSKCSLGTEWGLTGDSCESDYFDYSHVYSCSAGTINTLEADEKHATCSFDANGNVTNSPCVQDGACYFRPRVHVRDNWGWCTGTCEEGSSIDEDNSTSCYDGYQESYFMSATSVSSECAYQTYPSASSSAPDNDPWVYYGGNVIVVP